MVEEVRLKPGDVLGGKYRVERVLGAGGMGIVVAARHIDLGQRVALKLMQQQAAKADPGQTERFLREARAAVQLKSAHCARVLDVGRFGAGEPYIVMEYLEGDDLDVVLERHGPLPPSVACAYVLQACEALAEAHGLGIIHRDLKPKNLFLTSSVDGKPLVKVLDFGVAKQIGIGGDRALTSTTEVFGSPLYMSPEQMRSAKDVDARSDVWSLGVCLYELLTGRPPFDAPGIAELCAMVLKDAAAPPSTLAPGIPPELDAAVLKCLTKSPAERYASVGELAVALEPFAGESGTSERILQVMAVVRRSHDETVAIDRPPGAVTPSTVSSWGTGSPRAESSRRLPGAARAQGARRVGPLLLLLAGLLAVAGAVLIGVATLPRSSEARRAPDVPELSTKLVDAPPEPDDAVVATTAMTAAGAAPVATPSAEVDAPLAASAAPSVPSPARPAAPVRTAARPARRPTVAKPPREAPARPTDPGSRM